MILPNPIIFGKPFHVWLGILSLVGMLAFSLGKSQKQEPVSTVAPEISLSPTPEVSPSPLVTPTSTPTDETVLIRQAVYQLTGLNETKAEVSI